MMISRRDFLNYCTAAAGALGLSKFQLACLAQGIASPTAPTVLWLQGSGCSGCTISFLNHISSSAPHDIAEILIDVINLAYHPTVMAAAGETAVEAARLAYEEGDYILCVEGGVPTAFDGNACQVWAEGREEVTFEQAIVKYAERASEIICVGQCSGWGGVFAAPPNPTGVRGVSEVTGYRTINVAGCPPHPDWIVWVVARLLAGVPIKLDEHGRPQDLYKRKVHSRCPLQGTQKSSRFGQEGRCLEELGCRGKYTNAECPIQLFNGGVNWCIGAGAPCFGCVEPTFPGTEPFFNRDD